MRRLGRLAVAMLIALMSLPLGLATVSFANSAPTITVGGTVTYTKDNPPVVVAPNLTVTGGDDLNGARVAIGAGFIPSEDRLGIQGQGGTSGSVSGLSWSYNTTTGVLALSGTASTATYQAALGQVTYANNSQNPSTTSRTVTFSLGTTLAFPDNGHYYEFVPDKGITWTRARDAAEDRTLYGMQGYLATITTANENAFIVSKVQGNGWLGANDSEKEGDWKWVTGPEAGTTFCIGTSYCAPQGGRYTNWDSGEPNNCCGNEDYMHMLGNPAFGSRIGMWNDLYDGAGGIYTPLGYVVEYGGMPGDPTLQLSGSATVIVVAVNDLPSLSVSSPSVTVNEGQTATNSGTYGDVDHSNSQVTVTASAGTITQNTGGTWSWSFATTDGPVQSQEITITASDEDGGVTSRSFPLVVNNVAPTVDAGADQTAHFGATVTVVAGFSDPGTKDTWTYSIDWGDGSPPTQSTATQGNATITASHQYTTLGPHVVTVCVTDDDTGKGCDTLTVTVINSAGKVTGGGLRGANNGRGGFNVQADAGGVKGELQWQNNAVNFHASQLTALGITPDRKQAWFAGVGRDGRKFIAYAADNGEPGKDDLFRLWIEGVEQTAPSGQITGGNVQIHK